jgi:hypothetical protein
VIGGYNTKYSSKLSLFFSSKELEKSPQSEAGKDGTAQSSKQLARGNSSKAGYFARVDEDENGPHSCPKVSRFLLYFKFLCPNEFFLCTFCVCVELVLTFALFFARVQSCLKIVLILSFSSVIPAE